jgi:hypothetical protein
MILSKLDDNVPVQDQKYVGKYFLAQLVESVYSLKILEQLVERLVSVEVEVELAEVEFEKVESAEVEVEW